MLQYVFSADSGSDWWGITGEEIGADVSSIEVCLNDEYSVDCHDLKQNYGDILRDVK